MPAIAINFNCYFFPKWYAGINMFWANVFLLIIWMVLSQVQRKGIEAGAVKALGCGLVGEFLLVYAIFFGRTVYPAIDQGFGGGAPQLTEIETKEKTIPAILLFSSSLGRYFLELSAFPEDVDSRAGYKQYVLDAGGPVHKAMLDNRVVFLPNDEIISIVTRSVNQAASYNRYIVEGKHIVP